MILLGLVGEVTDVNGSFIRNLLNDGYLPVIAPIGVDENGIVYNVNADIAAGPIALLSMPQNWFI